MRAYVNFLNRQLLERLEEKFEDQLYKAERSTYRTRCQQDPCAK